MQRWLSAGAWAAIVVAVGATTGCSASKFSATDAGQPGPGLDGAVDPGSDAMVSTSGPDGGTSSVDGSTVEILDAAAPDGGAVDGSGLVNNGCVTTIGGGRLLFGFDNGDVSGWFDDPASIPRGAMAGTAADGVTCPGALTYTVPFSAYGQKALVDFNWPSATPSAWYGTKLHFSVKIVLPGNDAGSEAYRALFLIQPMMLWNDWANGYYDMYEYTYPTLADGQWHEVVLPLTQDGSPFLEAVDGFRLLVQDQAPGTQGGPVEAGPYSPPTAEYLFDDIWLE
ncbi:MAG: hypothetical protein ACRELB_22040 [Polyangiaceae bacterium]